MKLAELAQPVRLIAGEAAQRILAIYAKGFEVTEKPDHTPLTEADLAAHDIIVGGLTALDPAIPILSEEAADIDYAERRHWDWLWIVDPLDGTREFIRRSGEFCINIALIHQHTAVFGLIQIPTSGTCYYGYRGGGAFKQVPDDQPRAIHTRRVGRSRIRVAGSRSHTGSRIRAYLSHLGDHVYQGVGSALKSCLVAEGKVDLYPKFGPTSEWDTAAAQIIVEEAGGGLTDLSMRPLAYNTRPSLENPEFFAFGDPSYDWSKYLRKR
jgi:3'(2'), 5'-bisphosphate nucleotidase